MKARIKTKDKIYDAVIFAILWDGWKTKIVAFDENNEELKLIDYWTTRFFKGIVRHVFILDKHCENWVEEHRICGFDWFIDVPKIFENIRKNRPIDPEIEARCRKMQMDLEIFDKGEIKSQIDIENMLYTSQHFHDARVTSMIKEKDKIIIDLDTTWGCGVVFTLEGEPVTNLNEEFGNMGEILDSSMFFEDGRIFWVNCDAVVSSKDILKEDGFFSAERVSWKIEIY